MHRYYCQIAFSIKPQYLMIHTSIWITLVVTTQIWQSEYMVQLPMISYINILNNITVCLAVSKYATKGYYKIVRTLRQYHI